jgi:hypothetical protein
MIQARRAMPVPSKSESKAVGLGPAPWPTGATGGWLAVDGGAPLMLTTALVLDIARYLRHAFPEAADDALKAGARIGYKVELASAIADNLAISGKLHGEQLRSRPRQPRAVPPI